jgi:putative copper export protein
MLRLWVVWLHLVAATAWVGGLLVGAHLLLPTAARGAPEALRLLQRARLLAWPAVGILLLTGIENLRRSGLGPWLAAKIVLVIALVALAAHRDFALLPRAVRAVNGGLAPAAALRSLRVVDGMVAVLALAVLFAAVGVARGR